ncbi:hypothetical protein AKJ45_01425 [candidate division MSBL1 archaeon SCGC-AAA261F19]|uniref:Uncharacterized protein n=1 Tax=candidate division MSBL1 archaeon SCGC-AAA261F19 TaxID=1698275 RepID=A0A133VAL7_9EURY|nr:hypothetical protein AKJ45_01425 [candidate division MSBL1 archaeon SCGC-AAA261F19]
MELFKNTHVSNGLYSPLSLFKGAPTNDLADMLGAKDGLASTDVIRSMRRLGFQRGEIYDTLTGTGLPGEEIQLLIDRVEAEFEDAQLEPRTSRLAEEVDEIFRARLEESKSEFKEKLRFLDYDLQSIKSEVKKLKERIVELQTIICRDFHED